jgi:hypothetical protein
MHLTSRVAPTVGWPCPATRADDAGRMSHSIHNAKPNATLGTQSVPYVALEVVAAARL